MLRVDFPPQEVENVVARAHHVADDGGNGRAGDLPTEGQDHNGVQHHIQKIAQELSHHGRAGASLCPDDIGIAVGNKHKGSGQ